jgi:hydroxymethylbilane synthase
VARSGEVHVEAVVGSLDGVKVVRDEGSGACADIEDARRIGVDLAERLLAAGADVILREIRAEPA